MYVTIHYIHSCGNILAIFIAIFISGNSVTPWGIPCLICHVTLLGTRILSLPGCHILMTPHMHMWALFPPRSSAPVNYLLVPGQDMPVWIRLTILWSHIHCFYESFIANLLVQEVLLSIDFYWAQAIMGMSLRHLSHFWPGYTGCHPFLCIRPSWSWWQVRVESFFSFQGFFLAIG